LAGAESWTVNSLKMTRPDSSAKAIDPAGEHAPADAVDLREACDVVHVLVEVGNAQDTILLQALETTRRG